MNVLVLKVSSGEAVVMTDNEEFMTIPAKDGMKEGAAFEYTPQQKTWKRYAVAAAAMLLLCVLGFGAFSTFMPASYIDININPGVRLAVNQWGKVISTEAINEDGSVLISEVSGSLSGDPEASVKLIIDQAWKDGTLKSSGHILLTISDNDLQRAQRTEMKLMVSALEAVKGTGLSVDITLQKMDREAFEALRKEQDDTDDKGKSGVYDPGLLNSEEGSLYIEEAGYAGNGVIEVEFCREVLFTGNESITVEDLSGVRYAARVKEAGGKKLLLQCGELKEDNIYKITVENIGAEGEILSSFLYINSLETEGAGQNIPYYNGDPGNDENSDEDSYDNDDDSDDTEAEPSDNGEDDDDKDAGGGSEIDDDDEEEGNPDTGETDDGNEDNDEPEGREDKTDD